MKSNRENSLSNVHNCAQLIRPKTLAETLEEACEERKSILPGLVNVGETTLVHVAPRVNSDPFAFFISYSCAFQKKLVPFGDGIGAVVLHCRGAGHQASERKIHELVSQRDTKSMYQSDLRENLSIQDRFRDDGSVVNLCSKSDQRIFLKSLPDKTQLIVFQEIEAWTNNKSVRDEHDTSSIAEFARELNDLGIAVLIFVRSTKNLCRLDSSDYGHRPNLVWLTPDTAAPNEIGGGFCVSRNKMDEQDPVPTNYRFWYSTVGGTLNWGWDFITQLSPSEEKQLAIEERQIKVKELVAQGMPQNSISKMLGVNAATICRDVAQIKKKPPKQFAENTE